MKKKIVFLGPFPPPHGGIAYHLKSLFESSLREKYELISVNISMPYEKTENVSSKKGVGIYKVFTGLYHTIKTMAVKKPKVLYVEVNGGISCFREMLYIIFSRIICNPRIVMHFHGMLKSEKRNFPFIVGQENNYLNKMIINFLFSLAHRVIFISDSIADCFRKILNEKNITKTCVIENFIETKYFLKSKKRDRNFHILFIGRLSKAKGFYDLLEIIPKVIEEKNDIIFDICGAAENKNLEKEIDRTISELDCRSAIKKHGLVYGRKKQEIFAMADILVLPTYNDVFPLTIIEGMAQGIPIITTRVGFIPSIINEKENGLLLMPGEKEKLKSNILELINNSELRNQMAKNNLQVAKKRFDLSNAVNKLNIIFNEEINK